MIDRLERTCRFSRRTWGVPRWVEEYLLFPPFASPHDQAQFPVALKYTTKESNVPFGICYVIKDNSEIVVVTDPFYLTFHIATPGKIQSTVPYKVLLGLLN
jgi:hypothetical protein